MWDNLQRDVVRSYTAKFMEQHLRSDFNETGLALIVNDEVKTFGEKWLKN